MLSYDNNDVKLKTVPPRARITGVMEEQLQLRAGEDAKEEERYSWCCCEFGKTIASGIATCWHFVAELFGACRAQCPCCRKRGKKPKKIEGKPVAGQPSTVRRRIGRVHHARV